MHKEYDAVKEMRSIRQKLQEEHEKNPDLRQKRLEQVRKKYGLTKRSKNTFHKQKKAA
jgi:hypothetical protein